MVALPGQLSLTAFTLKPLGKGHLTPSQEIAYLLRAQTASAVPTILKVDGHKRVYEDSTHLLSLPKPIARYYGRRFFTTCAVSSLLRQVD
jgi:hypothetical protein